MYNPVNTYIEHNSPHIHRKRTSRMCMWHVIIALIPSIICAVILFGLPAIEVIVISVVTSVLCEWAIVKYLMPSASMSLVAAALTGLLLALNLPAGIAWWTVILGAVFAIGIGKMVFGGIGCNIFNPALVGRVFLLISFPVAMTTWPLPSRGFVPDGATGATILSMLKHGAQFEGDQYTNIIIGNVGGSLGEVAAGAILLGLIYLVVMRVISLHIPVSILATVALFDVLLDIPVSVDLVSGGLLLGAVFMATDYVTSPMTRLGMVIYGVMIGMITVAIRRWGAYPEGMSFAILIMNGFTPLINQYCKPRRYGKKTRKEVAA